MRDHLPRSILEEMLINKEMFCALLFLVHSGSYVKAEQFQDSMENLLLSHLFSNKTSTGASPSVRPVRNSSEAITVAFNLKLWQLLDVNEKGEQFTAQCYYQMDWINQLIVWNPKDWGGVEMLVVSMEKVWTPDIALLNSASENKHFLQKTTSDVKLFYNGLNTWTPQVVLTSSFVANTTYFPFDAHHFPFKFRSWNLEENKLRLVKTNRTMCDHHFNRNTEWELLKTSKHVTSDTYMGTRTETYSSITFEFTFRRKPYFYVMSLITPCSILACVVFFSYFLPASSAERSGVVVTILLAFAVFLEVLGQALPHKSSSILSLYILVIMFECTVSFLGTCVVITLRQKGNNEKTPQRPPCWIRKYFGMDEMMSSFQCNSCKNASGGDLSSSPTVDGCIMNVPGKFLGASHCSLDYRQREAHLSSLQLKQLNDISRHLKLMSNTIAEGIDENEIQMEWNYLAKIIDRTCRWLFLIVVVLSHASLVVLYRVGNPYFDYLSVKQCR